MGVCKGITQGSAYSCTDPLKSGLNETLLVGNLDDIETILFDPAIPDEKVIIDIIMKAGTALQQFEGVRSSNVGEIGLIVDELSVQFFHQIAFSAFEIDSKAKLNLQGLAAKRSFAIWEGPKDSSLGNSVFEALGINSGLEMTVLQRLPSTKDGSYKITLRTPEAAGETSLPNSVFVTSIALTEDMLAEITSGQNLALVSATVETGSPSDIILTFDKTIVAVGAITLGGVVNTFVSATIATVVVTVVVGTPYAAAESILLSGTFDSADGVITLSNQVVTNNVV